MVTLRQAEAGSGNPAIDVMMPVARKDMDMVEPALNRLVACSQTPIRKIFIVWQGPEKQGDLPPTVALQGAHPPEVVWVDEKEFPFTLKDVDARLKAQGSTQNHAGWYYQQLLKLYSFEVLSRKGYDVLPHLLIHDADIAFTNPVDFLDTQGRSLLAYGYPFRWLPERTGAEEGNVDTITHSHVDHAKRFIPNWHLDNKFTGMQHHQLLDREIMQSMFSEVQAHHHKDFWKAFIDCVDTSKWNGASEYILYFHYALDRFPDKVAARHLRGADIIFDSALPLRDSLEAIAKDQPMTLVGRHGFVSLVDRIKSMDYISPPLREELLRRGGEAPQELAMRLELKDGALDIEPWQRANPLQAEHGGDVPVTSAIHKAGRSLAGVVRTSNTDLPDH